MPATLRHFAICADDPERARVFYRAVFEWQFDPWGPPGFFRLRSEPGDPILGALQRRPSPLNGTGTRGFDCTIGVDDLDDTLARVVPAGGRLLDPPFAIEGVGTLAFIEDTEANRVGVMQYEPAPSG